MAEFQITTRGIPARADEWLLTQNTPESELPQLNDDDKRHARNRRWTDEMYARHLLLRSYAKQREKTEAEQIGEVIQTLFRELNGEYKLNAIVKRGFEPGWRVLIESRANGKGRKFYDVSLPTEDFSGEPGKRILNGSSPEEIRSFLLAELGLDKGQRAES